MQLVDTHCHLDVADFSDDYRQVIVRAAAAGVADLVVPAVDRAGWVRLLALCAEIPGCHAALGLHPLYLHHHRPADLDELAALLAGQPVCAVGEIGLDFWEPVGEGERRQQQDLFVAQVLLAERFGLPILVHARKAHDQVLAILRRLRFSRGGIAHAFNGSRQQAEQYRELGFMIGICGTITYPRAARVRSVATTLPLEALVLETDAPDIPPAGHHRQRNSPEYLPEILAALAALRPESIIKIAQVTSHSARTLLRLG